MIKKLILAAVVAVVALPLGAGEAAQNCDTWNAWSAGQHHKAGPIDVVGGHGYGSGYHDAGHKSPPQPMGAYGDPQRRGGEGGYIQGRLLNGAVSFNVNAFGPSDENDTTHLYDTVFGMCVQAGAKTVKSPERCLKTSKYKMPTSWGAWTPCGGY